MELTDWQRGEIDTLIGLWEYFRYPKEDLDAFAQALMWMGWKKVGGWNTGGLKVVLYMSNRPYIIKFDRDSEMDTRTSHTYWEWRKWRAATTRQRKHMAECIAHYRGILFQERLVGMRLCWCRCKEGETLARSLNIHQSGHWGHHAHGADGVIKFFDYGGGF